MFNEIYDIKYDYKECYVLTIHKDDMNINDTGFILQIFDTHEEAKLAAKKFVLSDRYKSLCIELGKDQLDWTIQRAEYYVKRIE